MANTRTEYQVEYCGMRGEDLGGKKGNNTSMITPCSKSIEIQPVGGRCQEKARAAMMAAATSLNGGGLPIQDADYVAQVYSESERGTHRVQPGWKDPRWSDAMRAQNSTLYQPAGRDPPNRNNFYVYKSTKVDSLDTPCRPLAVPDVHKLRYQHNNYMTQDDWY